MRTAAQSSRVAMPMAVLAAGVLAVPAQASYAPRLDVTIDPSAASTPTALTATVTQGAGDDPTRTVAVTVPAGFPLSLSGPACSGGQEAAFACPEASRIGIASVATPAGGLDGNVYFGGASGSRSKLVLLLSDGAPLFPRAATFEGYVDGSQLVVDGLSATALTLHFAGAPRALVQTPATCGEAAFLGHFVSEAGAQADSRSTVNVDGCVALPPQISDI